MNEFYEDYTGQESFFPIDTRPDNMVVQSNDLIGARQNLELNEAKMIRIIIMQILSDDVEFRPYEISINEFSQLIGNKDSSNLYRRARLFCESLQTKRVNIHLDDGSWQSIVWVPTCSYDAKAKKIKIRLNDDLKPYLLNLVNSGYYTQYVLENILYFNSVYALRIYELLMRKTMTKIIPKGGMDILLSISEIRDACMLYKTDNKGIVTTEIKFERVSQLKEKVIDLACKEINAATMYTVSYSDKKEGRNITGFIFHLDRGYTDKDFMSRRIAVKRT